MSEVKRDNKGRWLKGGAPKSPGRPPLSAELPVKDGIKAATSAEQVAQVLEKLFTRAMGNDNKAAELYLAYALGKPQQLIDVTSNGETLKAYVGISPDDWPSGDSE